MSNDGTYTVGVTMSAVIEVPIKNVKNHVDPEYPNNELFDWAIDNVDMKTYEGKIIDIELEDVEFLDEN